MYNQYYHAGSGQHPPPPPGGLQTSGPPSATPPGSNMMSGPPGGNMMGGPPPAPGGGPFQDGHLTNPPPPSVTTSINGPGIRGGTTLGSPPGGNVMGGPPGGNVMGGPPGGNVMGGPPGGMMGGPPGGVMGGPPGGMMGGPPGGMMGGPPSGSTSQPPAPKSNVQFFSVSGGGTEPTPTSFSGSMMPPPPSQQLGDSINPPHGVDNQQYQGQPPLYSSQGNSVSMQQPMSSNSGSFGNMGGMTGIPGFDSAANNFGPGGGGLGLPSQGTNQQGGHLQQGQPDPNLAMQQLPRLEDMDLSIQCDQRFLRCSVGKVVQSQGISQQCRFPLGIVCHPMSGEDDTENNDVEVVDFGSTGIVRCKRCRTYINPFVSWVDNGRRWRCNICGMLNDVPTSYFSHLDQQGQRRDKNQRPELNRCSVEFVAPGDYMVRPPQPPVYFFVIDVTSSAGSSGMLSSCVNAIRDSLDKLPGDLRTQIGK